LKVLLVNGSSHPNGTTMRALNEMIKVFEDAGVETEVIQLGGKPIADCLQCNACQKTGKCVFKDDGVNDFVQKAYQADGFVFASPTYFAHPSGRLLSFLDRAFYSNGNGEVYDAFRFKPGAAVVTARRGGTSTAYDVINKYFGIAQMPIAASTYWNNVHGLTADDAVHDEEGLQVMRNLARNMIWMMKASAAARKADIEPPENENDAVTNFIQRDDKRR
jgi:multimeric flavodoxin WrbA